MLLDTQAIFGADFYQDLQVIKISKTSLSLEPRNYSAEALFVALILRALNPFEGVITGNGEVVTGNGKPVTYHNHAAYDRLVLFFWQRNFFTNKHGIPIARVSYVLELYAVPNDETTIISVGEMES